MSILTSARRAELEAKLTRLESMLAALVSAYNAALASGMQSYRLDTGEGAQSATMMSTNDILNQIDLVQSQINSLSRTLTGGHMRRVTVNRKTSQQETGTVE